MSTLASKDSYIQKLASRICCRQERNEGTRKGTFVPFKGDGDGLSKKSKRKQKRLQQKETAEKTKKPKPTSTTAPAATAEVKGSKTVANGNTDDNQASKDGKVTSSFSAVDILRKRLHEKIEETKGQGDAPSDATQAKRAKRKVERERKKRKKKEFLMKKLAEKAGKGQLQEIKKEEVEEEEEKASATAPANKRDETAVIFNSVETVDEVYVDKRLKKENKKKRVKGALTPLTGKNYKQLLGRVEARKAKLDALRDQDEDKARQMEEKMRWTNVLYKAEGLKIKDDEELLRASLKRKEKSHGQKKRRWDSRSQNVAEKMRQRQDKRRRNIQRQNKAKMERKKERARKKGRVLPGDLKKASV